MCGGGGGGEALTGTEASACWGRTDTVGACVQFPTGHGSYGACPERTDTKQSLWGEAPQSREMPALPGRTCQLGDCWVVSTHTEPAGQYNYFRSFPDSLRLYTSLPDSLRTKLILWVNGGVGNYAARISRSLADLAISMTTLSGMSGEYTTPQAKIWSTFCGWTGRQGAASLAWPGTKRGRIGVRTRQWVASTPPHSDPYVPMQASNNDTAALPITSTAGPLGG